MIELIVKSFLETKTSLPVYVEDEPETLPERFLLIKNMGDSENSYIESATIAIESYGKSTYDSATINADVKKWMRSMIALNSILRVSLNTSYKDNDVTRKRYRYRATFEVTPF